MVRNIIGALVYIGKGKITAHNLKQLLHTQNRKKTFITAPGHGLFLYDIFYY